MQHGFALWTEYMAKAEKYSRDCERIVVDFDALISDFERSTIKLRNFLGGSQKKTKPDHNAIDPNLRHFKHDENTLIGIPGFIDAIVDEYSSERLSNTELDNAFTEFNNLKRFFFNASKQDLFSQFRDERVKYKPV